MGYAWRNSTRFDACVPDGRVPPFAGAGGAFDGRWAGAPVQSGGGGADGVCRRGTVGRNMWAKLFPGRLFKQVPKFASAVHVGGNAGEIVGRDVPMAIRMKDGRERVLGWTRFVHEDGHGDKTMVCLGVDLTDRLMAADCNATETDIGVGDAGTVEGDVVMPIAITPPRANAADVARNEAIEKVHGFLMEMEGQAAALQTAFSPRGDADAAAGGGMTWAQGAHACGLLELSMRVEKLCAAATVGSAGKVAGLMRDVVGMCRGGQTEN